MIKHSRVGSAILFSCIALIFSLALANLNEFECGTLATEEAVVDGGMGMVKGFIEEFGREAKFANECINIAVKKNYFELAEYLLREYYSKDPQRGAQAESTARNAVQQVRNEQNELLGLFEEMIPKEIPVITPALRWAQSANATYIEMKYSSRFDSPFACSEIFDEEQKIRNNGTQLYVTAMCRNDKKLIKYELDLLLQAQVNETESYFQDHGVGRTFINMTKVEQPSRWKSLVAEGIAKPTNMNLWWEMYEKYEKELPPSDEDDEEEEEIDEGEETETSAPKEPKKKRPKKKDKKKVGKRAKQDKQEGSGKEVNEDL